MAQGSATPVLCFMVNDVVNIFTAKTEGEALAALSNRSEAIRFLKEKLQVGELKLEGNLTTIKRMDGSFVVTFRKETSSAHCEAKPNAVPMTNDGESSQPGTSKTSDVMTESALRMAVTQTETSEFIQDETQENFIDTNRAENSDENVPARNKCKKSWTNSETSLMLDLYIQYVREIGPCKKFKNKKELWASIANSLNEELGANKDAKNVADKYKNVVSLKKRQLADKRRSGAAGGQVVDFQQQLDIIASLDDSISPEVMIGVTRTARKDDENSAQNPAVTIQAKEKQAKRKGGSYQAMQLFTETWQAVVDMREEKKDQRAAAREAAKQKRHEEKLARLMQIFGNQANNHDEA